MTYYEMRGFQSNEFDKSVLSGQFDGVEFTLIVYEKKIEKINFFSSFFNLQYKPRLK